MVATNSDPLLIVENLCKEFEASGPVLRGVNFEISVNRFTVILGPNGCGKTTLVRLIAGAIRPDSGNIRPGKVGVYPTRGIVFQKPLLLPWLTVKENIQLPLRLLKVDPHSFDKRLESLLKLGDLTDVCDRYPTKLSGGQRQKVALMRALITTPQLLVMDEPFSSLDDQTREELQNHLIQLQTAEQLSVLFVTHDLFEACLLADEVVVLSRKPASVVDRIQIATHKMNRRVDDNVDEEVLRIRHRLREGIYA